MPPWPRSVLRALLERELPPRRSAELSGKPPDRGLGSIPTGRRQISMRISDSPTLTVDRKPLAISLASRSPVWHKGASQFWGHQEHPTWSRSSIRKEAGLEFH